MPDYGDDRGFRSRGVPANIGFDRAGPGRNYNRGYGPGDVTMSDVPFDPRSTFNRDTPVQTGGSRGEFAPPLYSGRNPFIQPIQTGGRQGEFGGMGRRPLPIYTGFGDEIDSGSYLSSRFGGGLDDAAGMNESARGMLEDAGFEVAGGSPLMEDERVIRTLWKNAHANIAKTLGLSPGEASKAPRGLIQREFERLENIYTNKRTYGGGIMKGLTKGNPLGLMMELAPAEPGMELLDEMFNPGVQTI